MSCTLYARIKPKTKWPWSFKMSLRDKLHDKSGVFNFNKYDGWATYLDMDSHYPINKDVKIIQRNGKPFFWPKEEL